jgi:hypothetical protein
LKLSFQAIPFQSVQETAGTEYGIFSDFFARINFAHLTAKVLEITIFWNIRDNQTFFCVAFKLIIVFGIDGKKFRFTEADDTSEKQKALIGEYDGDIFSFS